MGPEFYNIYVDKCLSEAMELTKVKIMLSAQTAFYEKELAAKKAEIEGLQKELEKALNKAGTKKKSETEGDF